MKIKKGAIISIVLVVLLTVGSFMVFAAENTEEPPRISIGDVDGQPIHINIGGSEEWTPPPGWGEATPITSAVIVNGTEIEFYAYEIYGDNFFRLRDIAYVLNGTERQFDVAWSGELNAVVITSEQPYTVIGGEMALGNSIGSFMPTPSNNRFILDGEEIALTAYLINGNDFVRLHDVGMALDFSVQFDGRILVDTNYPYGARLFIADPDSDWNIEIFLRDDNESNVAGEYDFTTRIFTDDEIAKARRMIEEMPDTEPIKIIDLGSREGVVEIQIGLSDLE